MKSTLIAPAKPVLVNTSKAEHMIYFGFKVCSSFCPEIVTLDGKKSHGNQDNNS